MPDDLMLLLRPSVQPYLMSWFRYDPPAVLAELEVPALVLQAIEDGKVDELPQLTQTAARWFRPSVPPGSNPPAWTAV